MKVDVPVIIDKVKNMQLGVIKCLSSPIVQFQFSLDDCDRFVGMFQAVGLIRPFLHQVQLIHPQSRRMGKGFVGGQRSQRPFHVHIDDRQSIHVARVDPAKPDPSG